MIELDHFISQSLTPAFVLSGIGVLVTAQNNRLMTITGRARELNARRARTESESYRVAYKQQVCMFMKRAKIVRTSMFLLYFAIGCMVLTAILIGLNQITGETPESIGTVSVFLLGLCTVFMSVVIQSWELIVALQTLQVDIDMVDTELNG